MNDINHRAYEGETTREKILLREKAFQDYKNNLIVLSNQIKDYLQVEKIIYLMEVYKISKNRCVGDYPVIGIRPTAWNAFSMDKEGQDYRVYQTYGPQFKKQLMKKLYVLIVSSGDYGVIETNG